ncbi:2-aminoadipate transaminase [Ferrimicrobium acidiphilum DSM 19497]|uniref:2-aminoadipate transaminase n=2 Tax=Ferrimicrobium acidiphilum TaxID=121039 RepID=A0A0D8FSM9_9ACTN|nr:2-aminoadipate transaminase [Ferrimicrobium acidiphilum DSM 19497]
MVEAQSGSAYGNVVSKPRSLRSHQLAQLLGDWPSVSRKGPLYARLGLGIRSLILDARIPYGVRLPGERSLAAELHVSRRTVSSAYAMLREEGVLVSRHGGGSWTQLPQGRSRQGAAWGPAVWQGSGWLDLAVAAIAGDPRIAMALVKVHEALPHYLTHHGYTPHGLLALREAVAEHYTSRGLTTSVEQIAITSGAQQAISLVVEALSDPLDPVAIETPTYPGALDVLRRHRSRVIDVGLDDDSASLRIAMRQVLPRLVYLIADYHNPTGRLLGATQREELVRTAADCGSQLLVDESFAELGFDDSPVVAPLASFGGEGRVISVGSMSKSYWAGLRVGWVRADRTVISHLVEARATFDMASPVVDQLLAAELIRGGSDLLDSRRQMLRIQRDALVEAIHSHLPNWQFEVPCGGISLWVNLGEPISTLLTARAESYQIRLASGPRFGLSGTLENFLRIPFTLAPHDIVAAIERLSAVVTDVNRGWSITAPVGDTLV